MGWAVRTDAASLWFLPLPVSHTRNSRQHVQYTLLIALGYELWNTRGAPPTFIMDSQVVLRQADVGILVLGTPGPRQGRLSL